MKHSMKAFFALICLLSADSAYAGVLENDELKVIYSDNRGYLISAMKKGDREPLNINLCPSVYVQAVGETRGRYVTFGQFKTVGVEKNDGTVTCRYLAEIPEGKIRIETETRLSGNVINARIKVNNESEIPILHVRYPTLQGICFTQDGAEDELLFPYLMSTLVKNPRKNILPPAIYPGSAGVNYMDCSGGGHGIAIIGQPKLLAAQYFYHKSPNGKGIMMGIDTRHAIRKGEQAEYSFEILLHSGDFKAAANHYRNFFYRHFPKPQYPDWQKYSNGYLAVLWSNAEYPAYTEEAELQINHTWRLGLNHVQYWGQTGRHSCPGYPLADPVRGGEDGLKAMFNRVHQSGLHTGAYFWGCGIGLYEVVSKKFRGVPWEQFPPEVRPPSFDWIVKNSVYTAARKTPERDLTKYPEWKRSGIKSLEEAEQKRLNPQILHPLAFQSAEFRDWLNFWIGRYETLYGIEVPYLDVFGLRPNAVEFNPHWNLWGDGTEGVSRYKFLVDLNRKFRGRVAGFSPMIEGISDCYNTQASCLISNFRRNVPAYRYSFPEMIVYEGMHNGCWWPDKAVANITNAYKDGLRFELVWKFVSDEITRIVHLRDSLMKIVSDARYEIEPVAFRQSEVQSALLDASDSCGLALLNFRNLNRIDGLKFSLPEELLRRFEPVFVLASEGTFRTVPAGCGEFILPNARSSSLLLCSKKEKVSMPVLNFVFPHQTPQGMSYELQILNPTKAEQNVTMRILDGTGREELGGEIFRVPARGQIVKRIPSPVKGDFTRRLIFEFSADGKKVQEIRRTYDPFFHDPSFEQSPGRFSGVARSGRHSLKVDAQKQHEPFITLPPEQNVTVSVFMKKDPECTEYGKVKLYNHQERKIYLTLRPAALGDRNGWVKLSGTFRNEKDSHIRIGFSNPNQKGALYFDQLEVKFP